MSTPLSANARTKERGSGAWTGISTETDDGGDGTTEPVVNVYTKLKDNKRCVLCALWGRRRFFGDWEWRASDPRCKKCVADAVAAKDKEYFRVRRDIITENRVKSGAYKSRANNNRGPSGSESDDEKLHGGGYDDAFSYSPQSRRTRPELAGRRPFANSVRRGSDASPPSKNYRRVSSDALERSGDSFGEGDPGDVSRVGSRNLSHSRSTTGRTRNGKPLRGPYTERTAEGADGFDDRHRDDGWAGFVSGDDPTTAHLDPLERARLIEAQLPSRAQLILDRAAILTGRSPGGSSYGQTVSANGTRPATVMSDVGPRAGRAVARRFDLQKNITATMKYTAPSVTGGVGRQLKTGKKTLAANQKDAKSLGSDDDDDPPFVSRVPEVRRSVLYPGAGYVPVRERLASAVSGSGSIASVGGQRASQGFRSSFSHGGGLYGGNRGLFDNTTVSAPVTPLYRRSTVSYGDVSPSLNGGVLVDDDDDVPKEIAPSRTSLGGEFLKINLHKQSQSPEKKQAPVGQPSSQKQKQPTQPQPSYVAGLMRKSGFGSFESGESSNSSPNVQGRGAESHNLNSPKKTPVVYAAAAQSPRPSSHLLRAGVSANGVGNGAALGSRDVSVSDASPAAAPRPKKNVPSPSREMDKRLSMYAPARRVSGGAKNGAEKGSLPKSAPNEPQSTPGFVTPRKDQVGFNENGQLVSKTTPIDKLRGFDELRPTPLTLDAARTPFDDVPDAFQAMALRERYSDDEFSDEFATEYRAMKIGSPASGLWFGSSPTNPHRAFRLLLDASLLSEEDAFAYKGTRVGRFVLLDGTEEHGASHHAAAYLEKFVRDAHEKGMTPHWWTHTHTRELVSSAFDESNDLFIGSYLSLRVGNNDDVGKTRDALVKRWGVAGTEALRDFHFDVAPETWNPTDADETEADINPTDHGSPPSTQSIKIFPHAALDKGDEDAVVARVLEGADASASASRGQKESLLGEKLVCVVAPGSRIKQDEKEGTASIDLPEWSDADALTRGVVVALRDRGARCVSLEIALGERDGEGDVAVDFGHKKAVVFLGAGSFDSGADYEQEFNFDGDGIGLFAADTRRVEALVTFVRNGGVFVAHGRGSNLEQSFKWFGLPWRFTGGRTRGEFFVNPRCAALSGLDVHKKHGLDIHAIAFDGVTGVAREHAVFVKVDTRLSPGSRRRGESLGNETPHHETETDQGGPCPFAAACVGNGKVVFLGAEGGNDATCDIVASFAVGGNG